MIPANAAPLAIALLGLLLGMRHATDPDHVIAVTTILSRERRLGRRRAHRRRMGTRPHNDRADGRRRDHRFQNCDSGPARPRDGIRGRNHADSARRRRGGGPRCAGPRLECAGLRRAMKAWSSMRTRTLTTARCMRIRTFTLDRSRRAPATTRRITIIASPPTPCRRSPRGGRCSIIRRRTRARTRGQRRDRIAGAERDSESAVGDALPRDFLRRHDHRNGPDHDRDRHAVHGRVAARVMDSSSDS